MAEKAKHTMRDAILYRGRDAQAEWSDGKNIQIFHARLSIIDLKTGGQPMQDAPGRFVIVFNGEIYNYRELRQAYLKAGAVFRTESDTEVILEGFRLKGARVCEDLNGMFAFAIWDTRDKQLFLARDRLGKKPLFWANLGGMFCFASTLDAFREMPGWQSVLSPSAILYYGITGTQAKGRTIYDLANALPPRPMRSCRSTAISSQERKSIGDPDTARNPAASFLSLWMNTKLCCRMPSKFVCAVTCRLR